MPTKMLRQLVEIELERSSLHSRGINVRAKYNKLSLRLRWSRAGDGGERLTYSVDDSESPMTRERDEARQSIMLPLFRSRR